jgi:predicted PurR-regulated permease PerM
MVKKLATTGPSNLRILLSLVLVVGILYFGKAFIVPLALAILLTFILAPIVRAFQHVGLRRVPAVLVTIVLALGVFGAVGWGVGLQLNTLVHELPEHKEKIKKKIADLRGSGEGALATFLQMIRELNEVPAKTDAILTDREAPAKTDAIPTDRETRVVVARPEESSGFESLAFALVPILEPLATAGLVVILVIFMLSSREDLRNRLIGLLGDVHLGGATRVIADTAQRLSSFLLTQLLVNVGFGALFGVFLLVIGVPYAFLWGFLTGLLRFVPYIGTWISVVFPLTLSFALSPDWTQPVLVLAVFAVMDLVVGNAVEPLLFGHSTGVTPIALLVAAAFWTWVWGAIGLVLSTPLTVCLVVLGQHVPRFKFFTLLLGDQAPLEAHVSYYQRLLSKDVKEAQEIASDYAKTHGLEKVFDDVLMPALVLAQLDRQEGLSTEDEEFFFQETTVIVAQLESEIAPIEPNSGQAVIPVDQDAHSVSPPVLILGCPAHEKAEELPLLMLTSLMKLEGVKVEVLSTKTLPGQVEERVGQEKPALVFIAVLPPGGLVQVRYLCKRLRRRFADLPVVIGHWGPRRNYDRLQVRLRSAGATYVTTSLLQAGSRIRALVTEASLQEPVRPSPGEGMPADTPETLARTSEAAESRLRRPEINHAKGLDRGR